MRPRSNLPLAFFLAVLAAAIASSEIHKGTPSLAIVPLLIVVCAGWREWKIATDAQVAVRQAKIMGLPWNEAVSAAAMFFGACYALFVLLIVFAGQHSQTIDFETMLVLPMIIAPVGAVIVGLLRFFWLRR
jgi:hypothetical protein